VLLLRALAARVDHAARRDGRHGRPRPGARSGPRRPRAGGVGCAVRPRRATGGRPVRDGRAGAGADDEPVGPHPLSPVRAGRAADREARLVAKGFITTEAVDAVVDAFQNEIGPRNGARVVARAWVDPDFKERLLADATAAVGEMGIGGPEGEHLVAVENTPAV